MARGQARGAQSSSYSNMKTFLRNRMWREYQYAVVSVGLVVVVLFVSAFLQFSTSQDHVYRIEVTDSALMDRVFRSGEPWVVLCSGPNDVLPEVFDKIPSRLAGTSFMGVLDCEQKLPTSGKSVLERYGIKSSISPTVFTVANGGKPKQVFLNYLQSAPTLAKHVKAQTKKVMQQVQNSAQLQARCLSKSECVLFLRGRRFQPYEKQWIDTVMNKHRTYKFVWIDSTRSKLSLESMLPEFRRGEHRMVLFRYQRDVETRKKVLAVKAFSGDKFNVVSVEMFLDNYTHAESLTPLRKSPKILQREWSQAAQPRQSKGFEHKHAKLQGQTGRDTGKDDAYYFPQHVDQNDEDSESIVLSEIEEEEEVLDLDDAVDE